MIIPCFRCGKGIDSPDASNADYIIAKDTIVNEEVDVLEAVQLTAEGKGLRKAGLAIAKEHIIRTEVPTFDEADWLPDVERVEATKKIRPVQKTGIVCPDCHKKTDFVIWGVHKKKK